MLTVDLVLSILLLTRVLFGVGVFFCGLWAVLRTTFDLARNTHAELPRIERALLKTSLRALDELVAFYILASFTPLEFFDHYIYHHVHN